MDQMKNLIPPLPDADTARSYADVAKMRVESYNAMPGKLQGYECDDCKNKGYIAKFVDGEEIMAECKCMKVRDTLQRIKNSGLELQLKKCTFKSFRTDSEWQQQLKDVAADFIKNNAVGFFVGGQSGCGKTHICTAIVGHMIKQGMSARYFVWRDDSTALKSLLNDKDYTTKINEFKTADVLYIDDLFKQKDIKDADIKLAFEIIDYRIRKQLKTIISTELQENELLNCDEALTSRIFEMSRGYRVIIPRDRNKNYRLR